MLSSMSYHITYFTYHTWFTWWSGVHALHGPHDLNSEGCSVPETAQFRVWMYWFTLNSVHIHYVITLWSRNPRAMITNNDEMWKQPWQRWSINDEWWWFFSSNSWAGQRFLLLELARSCAEDFGTWVPKQKVGKLHQIWLWLFWPRCSILGPQVRSQRHWGRTVIDLRSEFEFWNQQPTVNQQPHCFWTHLFFPWQLTAWCAAWFLTESDPLWLCEVHLGRRIELEHSFASEAPGTQGLPQKRMLLLNSKPNIIYDDLLAAGLQLRWPVQACNLNLIFSFFVAVLCCGVGNIYRKMQLVALDWFWLHCRTFSAKERDDFKKGGLDWVTGSKKTVPAVTIYTGGFECQDGWHDSHDSWLMSHDSWHVWVWVWAFGTLRLWVFKSNSIRYTVSGIRLEVGSLAGVRLADRLLDWSSPV